MTYEYTTPEKVQAELRLSTAFSGSTIPTLAQVQEWIREESEEINSLSQRIWGSTTYTDELVDYDGQAIVALKHAPIISIASVEYNLASLGRPADWVAKTEELDYDFYKDSGDLIINFNNWSPLVGRKRFRVTYVAGFNPVPLNVQKLCSKMVALRVVESAVGNNVSEGALGGAVSIGGVNVNVASDVGVGSYTNLRNEVSRLQERIVGSGVMRYGSWYSIV